LRRKPAFAQTSAFIEPQHLASGLPTAYRLQTSLLGLDVMNEPKECFMKLKIKTMETKEMEKAIAPLMNHNEAPISNEVESYIEELEAILAPTPSIPIPPPLRFWR
jgi:hypothetical protein